MLPILLTAKSEHLKMSRFNLHVKGLHSIVLDENEGKLTRLYITSENHEMYLNVNENHHKALGVHSHRYDLKLTGIVGTFTNINYKELVISVNLEAGVKCYKWSYCSTLKNGQGAHDKTEAMLTIDSITSVRVGEILELKHHELHTVYVPKGKICAWLVEEGETKTTTTTLYQNGNTSGYPSSSFDDVDWIRDFVKDLLIKAEK